VKDRLSNRTESVLFVSVVRQIVLFLQFASVAVYFKFLGEAQYGVNGYLLNICALASMIDCSIPTGIQYVLGKTAKTSEDEFNNHFRTGLTLTIIYSILMMLIIAGTYITVIGRPELRGVPYLPQTFALAGFAIFLGNIAGIMWMPVMAKEEFRPVALNSVIVPLVTIVSTVVFVILLRNPIAFSLGMIVDTTTQLILRVYGSRKYKITRTLLPGFDRASFDEIWRASLKSFLPSIGYRLGANADKVAVGQVLGMDTLSIYRLAFQIPQIVSEISMRFVEFATPEMSRLAATDKQEFSKIIHRNLGIAGAVAFSSILFVSAFGQMIQQVWVPAKYENFVWVCFLMGVYYSWESYHSILTKGFFAENKMHLTAPFALFNTLVTVFATPFIAKKFGLVGVGAMNAMIDLVQIFPFHYMAAKHLLNGTNPLAFTLRSLRFFGYAIMFCIPVILASPLYPNGRQYFPILLIVPVAALLLFASYFRFGLVEVPAGLRRLLEKRSFLKRLFGLDQGSDSI
jgi:O-antigen/teichoic acid export membrane protein